MSNPPPAPPDTPSRTRRTFVKASALAIGVGLLPAAYAHKWRRSGAPSPPTPAPPGLDAHGIQSLRAHADARGLLCGCAVVPARLDSEPDYAAAVIAQANILVAENAMKWAALRPSPDRFSFNEADALAAFASSNGQRLRGHNLCWHEGLPAWFAATATRENARRMLTEHIRTVAGRYAGRIHSWDVVNEAVDSKGDRPDGLRKSPWLELAGSDYIELAFHAARAADPAALLTYNDYGIELDTPEQSAKRAQVLLLVRRLKARGVPLDAVGVQSHLEAGGPVAGEGLRAFLREMRAMGLQVFVTEMDVSDRRVAGTVAERDTAVAQVYAQYLALMLADPNVSALLTWGITDRYSWIGHEKPRADGLQPRPLPLDPDYHPAPALFALRNAIDLRRLAPSAAPANRSAPETAPPATSYEPFTPRS